MGGSNEAEVQGWARGLITRATVMTFGATEPTYIRHQTRIAGLLMRGVGGGIRLPTMGTFAYACMRMPVYCAGQSSFNRIHLRSHALIKI